MRVADKSCRKITSAAAVWRVDWKDTGAGDKALVEGGGSNILIQARQGLITAYTWAVTVQKRRW